MSTNKELLYRYLNGELNEEDKKAFIEIVAKDENFRRQIIRGVELDGIIDNTLKQDDRNLKTPQSSRRKICKIIYISAAVIILIGFFMLLCSSCDKYK